MADPASDRRKSPRKKTDHSRRYTSQELLALRTVLPLVICDLSKMNPDTTGDFLKLPVEAQADPRNFNCTTKDLNLWLSKAEHKSRSDTPINYYDHDVKGDFVAPGEQNQHHVKWAYRRRDTSERSSQPLPAPSGIDAQKAANFQRFYRAVVSPNHVRVTAGGRIIPNTLVSPQPMVNFFGNEIDRVERPMFKFMWPVQTSQLPTNWTQFMTGSEQLPIIAKTDKPTVWSEKSSSDGLMDDPTPWMQGVKLPKPETASASTPHLNESNFMSGNNPIKAGAAGNDALQQPLEARDESSCGEKLVEVAHPDTFDRTRPFTYNGQTHYPLPAAFHLPQNVPLLPVNVLTGPPPLPVAQAPSARAPSAMPLILYPANPSMFGATMQQPVIMASGQPVASGERPAALPLVMPQHGQQVNLPQFINGQPAMFPVTPMMPQLLNIKNQIQALEQQRNQLDNQLANNMHQIDVAQVSTERLKVQCQIDALQMVLLQFSQHAVSMQDQQVLQSQNFQEQSASWPMSHLTLAPRSDPQLNKALDSPTDGAPVIQGGNTNKAPADETKAPTHDGSNRRSRLSAASAKAPPFQPRSHQNITRLSTTSIGETSESSGTAKVVPDKVATPMRNRAPEEVPLPSSVSYSISSQPGSISTTVPLAQEQISHPVFLPAAFQTAWPLQAMGLDGSAAEMTPTSHRFNTFPRNSPTTHTGFTPAYLRGQPPLGMDPNRARSEDMVYPRPLTEEELRARHLYWGKAPREACKGLPKFDGRNFYPPSPVKQSFNAEETQSLKSNLGLGRKLSERNMPKLDYAGSDSPISTVGDPFRDSASSKSKVKPPMNPALSEVSSLDSWGASKFTSQEKSLLKSAQNPLSKLGSSPREHAQPSFLQGMLRKSRSTGLPTPLNGELTSATAQGLLPQFEGSAVASLNLSDGPSPSKQHRLGSKLSMVENRPPSRSTLGTLERMSAAQMLRKIKSHDNPLSPSRASSTRPSGTGPIIGDEW